MPAASVTAASTRPIQPSGAPLSVMLPPEVIQLGAPPASTRTSACVSLPLWGVLLPAEFLSLIRARHLSAQYLEAAEDYHWGNVGGEGPEHCFVNASTCQKDMWHNPLPGSERGLRLQLPVRVAELPCPECMVRRSSGAERRGGGTQREG